jgi:hypothetical protein
MLYRPHVKSDHSSRLRATKTRFVPVHPMALRLIGEYLEAGKHGGAVSHESLDSPLFRARGEQSHRDA